MNWPTVAWIVFASSTVSARRNRQPVASLGDGTPPSPAPRRRRRSAPPSREPAVDDDRGDQQRPRRRTSPRRPRTRAAARRRAAPRTARPAGSRRRRRTSRRPTAPSSRSGARPPRTIRGRIATRAGRKKIEIVVTQEDERVDEQDVRHRRDRDEQDHGRPQQVADDHGPRGGPSGRRACRRSGRGAGSAASRRRTRAPTRERRVGDVEDDGRRARPGGSGRRTA